MSARLLRRVLNEQQQKGNQQGEEQERQQLNGEESGSPESVSSSPINPFDLLIEENGSEIDEEGDMNSNIEVPNVFKDEEEQPKSKVTTLVSGPSKKSKKKKKKKKSKDDKERVDEDLDLILKKLSLDVTSEENLCAKAKTNYSKENNKTDNQRAVSILESDPKHLNAENELRRIFGSKVVKSFESSNLASSSRQIRCGRRGNHNLRKTFLVTPANHWPRWDSSLSMEFLETRDGYNYFRYVRSSSNAQAQRAFESTKAISDINGLASVLLNHPYHLDSLLTMAEYFKVVGEHQMSADATAKCLYSLECAWHPMFNPLKGNCRLKFCHDTNKPLFLALFTHMKNLDRRGCHRSALEVCKLLLSLDSDDPMGATFCIDYFSLRAEEYLWLERFSEEYTSNNCLWLFPNFSYSLALCRFYLELEASTDSSLDTEKATSIDLMKQALMLHPTVIKKLVAKVPMKDRVWTNIVNHSIFQSDETSIPSLDHLINIYVERNHIIWRLSDLQKLLSDAAQLVMKTVEDNEGDVENWACVRKEAFSSDKHEYSHLMVSDFSDSVATIPHENLQNFMVDQTMREVVQSENQGINPHINGHPHLDAGDRSPLTVLFESMLPWATYGDGESGPEND